MSESGIGGVGSWNLRKNDEGERESIASTSNFDPNELGNMSDVASVFSSSSAAEGDLESNVNTEKSSEHAEIDARLLTDPDFRYPGEITIPSIGDKLKENCQALCVAGEVVSPSEFYLALSSGLNDMDLFIEMMTKAYRRWFKEPRRDKWTLFGKPELAQPGGLVACFNPSKDARQRNEVVRARIIRDVSKKETIKYDVFLIDLGVFREDVHICDMFLLYETFIPPPAFGIKCRLHLDSYYDSYHAGEDRWKSDTTNLLTSVLTGENRKFTARFVRQVTLENGERIWEVSIPASSLQPSHNHMRDGDLVEKKVIKRTMGSFIGGLQ